MRVRVTVLVAALMACACAVTPSIAAAHGPVRDRALTIHNSPQSIVAGDPVLIYGRLLGRESANQRIVLWHRINPRGRVHDHRPHPDRQLGSLRVHPPERNRADQPQLVRDRPGAQSFADRPRAGLGRGDADRRAPPRRPPVTRSRSPARCPPGTPDRRSSSQAQRGDSNNWNTIKTARLDASSSYSIPVAWRFPGPAQRPRGVPRRPPQHARDLGGQQRRRRADRGAGLHDPSSNPIVPNQTPVTISGTLLASVGRRSASPASASRCTPASRASTTGLRRRPRRRVPTAPTASRCRARPTSCTRPGPRLPRCAHSAVVFQGVQDVVSITSSATAAVVGQPVTFSGNVSPGKPGDAVYLERLGKDGNWHIVESSTLDQASDYSIGWTFGTPGAKQVRVQVLGDPAERDRRLGRGADHRDAAAGQLAAQRRLNRQRRSGAQLRSPPARGRRGLAPVAARASCSVPARDRDQATIDDRRRRRRHDGRRDRPARMPVGRAHAAVRPGPGGARRGAERIVAALRRSVERGRATRPRRARRGVERGR